MNAQQQSSAQQQLQQNHHQEYQQQQVDQQDQHQQHHYHQQQQQPQSFQDQQQYHQQQIQRLNNVIPSNGPQQHGGKTNAIPSQGGLALHTQSTSSGSSSSNKMKVVAGYGLQHKLGSGSFAIVYKGVRLTPSGEIIENQDNDSSVAIKAIDRNSDKLSPKVLSNLEKEISILRNYKHRNIVCLQEVQKTANHFYLVLEYCAGGDLQRLIRDRAAGRLSERLCRRLMRDLCAGLKFLNSCQLIHRDIKPQNLLLTGSLPLDENDDPARTPELELHRQRTNFPSNRFILKIADFGFARHLQATSLAETLCGSPLYMAPEILSHQRYDEKADLWSVGTVLFEMISGKPPFSGDNHIHLLQNIQKNAVRLPSGVRVSKECVSLLRILLNRNPVSRANFREFVTNCDAFVSLGCNGPPIEDTTLVFHQNQMRQGGSPEIQSGNTESIMTVEETSATIAHTMNLYRHNSKVVGTISDNIQQQEHHQVVVTPTFGPSPSPPMQQPLTASSYNTSTQQGSEQPGGGSIALCPIGVSGHRPASDVRLSVGHKVYTIPENSDCYQHSIVQPKYALPHLQKAEAKPLPPPTPPPRSESYGSSSQHSSDDFVMVEHGSSMIQPTMTAISKTLEGGNNNKDPGIVSTLNDIYNKTNTHYSNTSPQVNARYHLQQSPPASPGLISFRKQTNGVTQTNDYLFNPGSKRDQTCRGMLSTSPGTGGALMGMLMGTDDRRRCNTSGGGLLLKDTSTLKGVMNTAHDGTGTKQQLEAQIKLATRMLAASEDVGRRAVCVAHLGDHRALQGIKLYIVMDSASSSMLSCTNAMEGIEEENQRDSNRNSNNNTIDDSSCTEITTYRRQRSSLSATDKTMMDEMEEMPFALESESPPILSAGLPTRTSVCSSIVKGASSSSMMHQRHCTSTKPTPAMIRSHFSEALLCYVKSLNMLKGAFAAVEKVATEVSDLLCSSTNASGITPSKKLSSDQIDHLQQLKQRCEVSKKWLGAQFNGVLERGDAANAETRKLQVSSTTESDKNSSCTNTTSHATLAASTPVAATPVIPTVEELIYNQALALGREGAVKQILGQNEHARSCYRSAGLLAETLLMDSKNVVGDDRVTLESYVDAFSAQISELDTIIVQQHNQQLLQQQQLHGIRNNSSRVLSLGGIPTANTYFRQPPTEFQRQTVSPSNIDGVTLPLALDPVTPST